MEKQAATDFDSFYLSPDLCTEEHLSMVAQERRNPPFRDFPHNPMFDKEQLMTLPDHAWMGKVDMKLITVEEFPSLLLDFLPMFKERLTAVQNPARFVGLSEAEGTPNPLFFALDLEAESLNKELRFRGGEAMIRNRIVGICLADSATSGFYIPINHTELDGVKNFTYEMGLELLQALQDEAYIAAYHNAQYDREVLELNKIKLNPEYIDSMMLLVNMGYKNKYMTVALKVMAQRILGRKMLEIKDLSGQKVFVPLQYLTAKSLTVYGCSDAANTYALVDHATASSLNPYKVNLFAMRVDHRANDITRWCLRHGMPLDYKFLANNLRTVLRRKRICEYLFKTTVTDNPDIPITSAEKVGIFLGSQLWIAFQAHAKIKSPELPEFKIFEIFQQRMKEHFYMDVKKQTLKSGTVKTKYGSGADVLQSYLKIDEKRKSLPWIPDSLSIPFKTAAKLLDQYRSVLHDLGVFAAMYRHSYVDDTNIHRCAIGLKFNGTVTTRYSNDGSKGSSDRYLFERMKTKTKMSYAIGETTAGFNLQGVSSSPIKLTKAYKVISAPTDLLENKAKLDKQVELDLIRYLEGL